MPVVVAGSDKVPFEGLSPAEVVVPLRVARGSFPAFVPIPVIAFPQTVHSVFVAVVSRDLEFFDGFHIAVFEEQVVTLLVKAVVLRRFVPGDIKQILVVIGVLNYELAHFGEGGIIPAHGPASEFGFFVGEQRILILSLIEGILILWGGQFVLADIELAPGFVIVRVIPEHQGFAGIVLVLDYVLGRTEASLDRPGKPSVRLNPVFLYAQSVIIKVAYPELSLGEQPALGIVFRIDKVDEGVEQCECG